ncbi:hypothetical protein STCU_02021 [Strigomonas culicis]|uniref:RING-type E3 ubiquitin transferase n=1 Tax=Strigomonas culicis TaxID=28005 RepID=S9U132_9TRYP|nr:hypothetical protein STCU_07163 [Strigomonas culicis]EPY33745.1 hypothetical protein STCU_02021 [Strigomonas culicis]|eukprot:EPY24472.1 hypothetical protein STCU_07163 [Strigomonas culicis]
MSAAATASSISPAVHALLNHPPGDLSVTHVSSLSAALKDPTTLLSLVGAAQRPVCKQVLARLLAAANDAAKPTALKMLCLECFYDLSRVEDEAFRTGELFQTVQQLNASFEEVLERDGAVLGAQREMLTVLLFRCTGYVRLRAGDLLQQLCGGDENRLTLLLMDILRNRSYEWPLLLAALRCLYELTTPVSYFTAGTAVETQKVSAFSAKIARMSTLLLQHKILEQLMAELAARWALSSLNRNPANGGGEGLGALGGVQTLLSVTSLSVAQKQELLQWAVALRYISVLVHNLLEYSDQPAANKLLQQSLLASPAGASLAATVAVPYVMAVLQAWERARAAGTLKENETDNAYLNSALAVLRLLRVTLYKPQAPVPAPLQQALALLAQQVTRLEPLLRGEYVGMLAILFTVECLCNVNAKLLTEPVNLAGSLDVLLTTVASDKQPLRPGAQCTSAQGFAVCFAREESPYVVTANESVTLLHTKFAKEEQEIKEDAEAYEAIERLEMQLGALQSMIMNLALGQLLGELAMAGVFNTQPGVIGQRAAAGSPSTSASSVAAVAGSPSKKKKKKHPTNFCCDLTGKLMKEPVVLKNGHRFELDALEDTIAKVGHVDPISGETFDEDEMIIDVALQQEIAQYRVNKATVEGR